MHVIQLCAYTFVRFCQQNKIIIKINYWSILLFLLIGGTMLQQNDIKQKSDFSLKVIATYIGEKLKSMFNKIKKGI